MAIQAASQHLSYIQVNPKQGTIGVPAIHLRKLAQDKNKVNFMEVKPPYTRYKCVSVLDIFSGWVKAFATQRETAVATVKTLLCEIIPRFQFPLSVRSDKDLPYFDHISDGQEGLDVTWELHCAH